VSSKSTREILSLIDGGLMMSPLSNSFLAFIVTAFINTFLVAGVTKVIVNHIKNEKQAFYFKAILLYLSE
jgi:hypothetical protein